MIFKCFKIYGIIYLNLFKLKLNLNETLITLIYIVLIYN